MKKQKSKEVVFFVAEARGFPYSLEILRLIISLPLLFPLDKARFPVL